MTEQFYPSAICPTLIPPRFLLHVIIQTLTEPLLHVSHPCQSPARMGPETYCLLILDSVASTLRHTHVSHFTSLHVLISAAWISSLRSYSRHTPVSLKDRPDSAFEKLPSLCLTSHLTSSQTKCSSETSPH